MAWKRARARQRPFRQRRAPRQLARWSRAPLIALRSVKRGARPVADAELSLSLVARVARRPRKRDHVAHVGEPRDVGDGPLEAQAETGVRHGAVATKVAVPAVVVLVHAGFGHSGMQHEEPLFALAAAYDFPDSRR